MIKTKIMIKIIFNKKIKKFNNKTKIINKMIIKSI